MGDPAPHGLEGSSVPHVQITLPFFFQIKITNGGIIDDVLRGGHEPVIFLRTDADDLHAIRREGSGFFPDQGSARVIKGNHIDPKIREFRLRHDLLEQIIDVAVDGFSVSCLQNDRVLFDGQTLKKRNVFLFRGRLRHSGRLSRHSSGFACQPVCQSPHERHLPSCVSCG